ncbi:MAG: hypothetical protein EOO85_13620 [Pedobacter sp.]|nr:MAG: hypothetical protein EOO85_13620 [Pedobacter sp.]
MQSGVINPGIRQTKFVTVILIFCLLQYGCTSYLYHKGGRVESKYRNYYFNDSLRVGAVLYGDMDLTIGNNQKQSAKISSFGKVLLKRFGLSKSDRFLFTSISKKYSLIGLVRKSANLSIGKFEVVTDRKDRYLFRSHHYKGMEAYEGLISLDSNRFLSLIDFGESDRENAKEGFHTIMINSARRIKAGEALSTVLDPFEDAEELFEEHGYLAPYKLAKNGSSYKEQKLYNQALATYYSFSGDQKLATEQEKEFIGFPKKTLQAKDLEPATSAILRRTINQKVVMFNTAHHRPEHAYFVAQFLDQLRKQGFTHLALEALSDSSLVMKNGFAIQSDGFYIRDPEMSNLMSKAVAIGFQIISYEDDSENRELGQARNLIDKTFKKDKHSRILILAGYAHINESSKPRKMASYFKELSGIDPLTIDQTQLMTSECNDLDKSNKEECFNYLAKDSESGVDMQIWNTISLENKPIGLDKGMPSMNVWIKLPDSLKQKDLLAIATVFDQPSFLKDANAIPLHVSLLPINTDSIKFNLYPGTYILRIQGEYKEVLYTKELQVK